MITASPFLPGVPADHVYRRLDAAGGNEIASGKLAHAESSAALAVNAFGWFVDKPDLLPSLPDSEVAGRPTMIDVEFCARFPWSGGRHPWLDAVVETDTHLIGVESKRFETFRDLKQAKLSSAYDRPVWGDGMRGFQAMRDCLRAEPCRFRHLDAAQLVKHALGLATEGRRRGRLPVLFYIFAEPGTRGTKPIPRADHDRHRMEIEAFAAAVAGDEVTFRAASYAEWLATWPAAGPVADHAAALADVFGV